MERYIGCILVEDASGCRFNVYVYRRRRAFAQTAHYVLETGEAMTRLSDGTFVIAATGETMVPVVQD